MDLAGLRPCRLRTIWCILMGSCAGGRWVKRDG